jgi:hypothetical protein
MYQDWQMFTALILHHAAPYFSVLAQQRHDKYIKTRLQLP